MLTLDSLPLAVAGSLKWFMTVTGHVGWTPVAHAVALLMVDQSWLKALIPNSIWFSEQIGRGWGCWWDEPYGAKYPTDCEC